MYLLDTNIIAELTKRKPNQGLVKFFSSLETVYISVITIHEINYGIARAEVEKKAKLTLWFDKFLNSGPEIVMADPMIAGLSGKIRANSEASGKQMTLADSIIAATAIHFNLVLATRNSRDFEFCGVSILNPFTN